MSEQLLDSITSSLRFPPIILCTVLIRLAIAMESNVLWLLLLTAGVAQGQRKFNTYYMATNVSHTMMVQHFTLNSMQSTANTLHQTPACIGYCTRVREVVAQKKKNSHCQIHRDYR